MNKIGDIIGKGEYKDKLLHKRIFKAKCEPELFKELFIFHAKKRLYGGSFIVDDENKEVINQLYYYLIGSPDFNGSLTKGILMIGNIGNGKTILMESFIEILNATSNRHISFIHAKDVAREMSERAVGWFNKRPYFIDDIGKEQEAIKVYGTVMHPMEDMINERYKNFALTFCTSNYKFDDMKYSKHMIDRLQEMMNVIILTGKSRRS